MRSRHAWVIAGIMLGTAASAAAETPPAAAPQELLDEAKALLVVGACADGTAAIKAEVYEAHCKAVRAAQEDYRKQWLAHASEFFKANVPAGLPKSVVYPFA